MNKRNFIKLVFFFTMGSISCQFREKEKFLIPNNYIGMVAVFFNFKDGKPVKYDAEGYRIYEIDTNGILITQFSDNDGAIPLNFIKHYYTENGKVIRELPYNDSLLMDETDYSLVSDSVCIFSKLYESGISNINNKEYHYMHFIVGRRRDAKHLFMQSQKVFLLDLIKR